jgi:putative ABC transport system substrate-binding protein
LLVNPSNPNVVSAPETEAAAKAIGRRLEVLTATSEGDLEAAFTTMIKRQAGALIVMADPLFFGRGEQLVALAARYRMPTIYPDRDLTEKGGLMSYGTNFLYLPRQAGTYVGKILRGVKPADLPVQQGFKSELVINLKTAKALELIIPPMLLARADEVIE